MALPWLESLSPAWAAPPRRPRPWRPVPQAVRGAVHGQRHQRPPLVGQGRRRRDGAGQEPGAAGAVQGQAELHHRPVQQAVDRAWASTPGRPATSCRACRCRRGRCSRAASAWTRCWPATSAQDTMQPSMVLGCEQPNTGYHETNFSMAYSSHISWSTPALAGADGGLPLAGLRQPVREPGQPAHPEHPRPGARSRPRGLQPPGQRQRPRQAGRVPDQRARGGKAGGAHARRQGTGRRPGQAPGPAGGHHEAAGQRACPRTSASTCG